MQLNLKSLLAASSLVISCLSFEASALRCFTSETLTAAPGEQWVYTGITRILLQLPAKGSIGPLLTFIGPEGVSQSPMICSRNNGRPFCSIEDDGGGFYYKSFKGKADTITTSGIPGIFYQDDGKTHPGFAAGASSEIALRETDENECVHALSRVVQSAKSKTKAPVKKQPLRNSGGF